VCILIGRKGSAQVLQALSLISTREPRGLCAASIVQCHGLPAAFMLKACCVVSKYGEFIFMADCRCGDDVLFVGCNGADIGRLYDVNYTFKLNLSNLRYFMGLPSQVI